MNTNVSKSYEAFFYIWRFKTQYGKRPNILILFKHCSMFLSFVIIFHNLVNELYSLIRSHEQYFQGITITFLVAIIYLFFMLWWKHFIHRIYRSIWSKQKSICWFTISNNSSLLSEAIRKAFVYIISKQLIFLKYFKNVLFTTISNFDIAVESVISFKQVAISHKLVEWKIVLVLN